MTATRSRSPINSIQNDEQLRYVRQKDKNPQQVVYCIGIFGWRKRCLYMIVLFTLLLAAINLALLVWIIRVQNFGLYGMGGLHITDDGIRINTQVDFTEKLTAQNIFSNADEGLRFTSYGNMSIFATDTEGKETARLAVSNEAVLMRNKMLIIKDMSGKELLYANADKLMINMNNMDIRVPGGLKLDSFVHTARVEAANHHNLKLVTRKEKMFFNGAKGISLVSNGNDVKMTSLDTIEIRSKKGEIVLDSHHLQFKGIIRSSAMTDARDNTNAREVCVCPDGSLFLAPATRHDPCKMSNGSCL